MKKIPEKYSMLGTIRSIGNRFSENVHIGSFTWSFSAAGKEAS